MTRFNEVKKIKPDEELVKEIHEQAKNIETKSDSDKKDNFGKKRFVINIDFGLKGKRDFSFELKIDALNIEAAKKEVYEDCYDLVIPNMVYGGILVADNAINHYETLKPMLDKALNDDRVDALIVPIGKGVLLCRKL